MEQNLAKMAQFFSNRPAKLTPHFKITGSGTFCIAGASTIDTWALAGRVLRRLYMSSNMCSQPCRRTQPARDPD